MKRVFQECVFSGVCGGGINFNSFIASHVNCLRVSCRSLSPLYIYGIWCERVQSKATRRQTDERFCAMSFFFWCGDFALRLLLCLSILLFSLFQDASKSHNLSNDMRLNRKILPSFLLLYFWSDEAKNFDFFTLFRFFFSLLDNSPEWRASTVIL